MTIYRNIPKFRNMLFLLNTLILWSFARIWFDLLWNWYFSLLFSHLTCLPYVPPSLSFSLRALWLEFEWGPLKTKLCFSSSFYSAAIVFGFLYRASCPTSKKIHHWYSHKMQDNRTKPQRGKTLKHSYYLLDQTSIAVFCDLKAIFFFTFLSSETPNISGSSNQLSPVHFLFASFMFSWQTSSSEQWVPFSPLSLPST